jgi:anti-sigma-K factor RskA
MRDMDHEELKSLIASYVLGAVPREEEAQIRAHLLTCEECMREADGYAAVTNRLATAAPPADLPAGFADRVVARARAEEDTRPDTDSAVVALPRRRRSPAILAAAALLVVTAVLAVSLVNLRGDQQNDRDVIAALLSGDDVFRLEGGGVQAAMVDAGDEAIFVAQGLEAAPDDRDYQLWLLGEERPVSAGIFDAEDGLTVLHTDRSLEGFSGAAVTIEPVGGSEQPTTDPILGPPA